jgi:hypothetical protein
VSQNIDGSRPDAVPPNAGSSQCKLVGVGLASDR